jgi:hypothetical protein
VQHVLSLLDSPRHAVHAGFLSQENQTNDETEGEPRSSLAHKKHMVAKSTEFLPEQIARPDWK